MFSVAALSLPQQIDQYLASACTLTIVHEDSWAECIRESRIKDRGCECTRSRPYGGVCLTFTKVRHDFTCLMEPWYWTYLSVTPRWCWRRLRFILLNSCATHQPDLSSCFAQMCSNVPRRYLPMLFTFCKEEYLKSNMLETIIFIPLAPTTSWTRNFTCLPL